MGYPKNSLFGRSEASLFETYTRLFRFTPEALVDMWRSTVEALKILGFLGINISIMLLAPVSFLLAAVWCRNKDRKEIERLYPGTFHRRFFVWVRTKNVR